MAQWYYQAEGKSIGPITSAQLKAMAEKGAITAATMIRKSDSHEWTTASHVRGLFPSTSESSPSMAPPPPPPARLVSPRNNADGILSEMLDTVSADWIEMLETAPTRQTPEIPLPSHQSHTTASASEMISDRTTVEPLFPALRRYATLCEVAAKVGLIFAIVCIGAGVFMLLGNNEFHIGIEVFFLCVCLALVMVGGYLSASVTAGLIRMFLAIEENTRSANLHLWSIAQLEQRRQN